MLYQKKKEKEKTTSERFNAATYFYQIKKKKLSITCIII